MNNDLDSFVQELTELIEGELRAAYGNAAFERWRDPQHMGSLDDPDGHARMSGSCDDFMEVYLKFQDDMVVDVKFMSNGCGAATACGSLAAEMALGKSVDELTAVTGEVILERLGGLPREEVHSAFLAGETVQAALKDYLSNRAKDGN